MTTETDAAATLAAAADDYWAQFLADEPVYATSIGDRRYDDRLPDRSPEAIADRRRRLAALRDRVAGVDAGALADSERVTLAELLGAIDRDDAVLSLDLEAWTVDPLEGPAVEALNLPSIEPIRTPEEGEAMVRRWEALGPWLDAHVENLRRGLADGRVAVRTPVRKTIEVIDEALAAPADAFALLEPAREAHDDWPAEAVERFRAGLGDTVDRFVRPALGRLRAFLADEVLAHVRPDETPAIRALPDGDDAYRALIAYHTSLPLTADELHRTGLDEVQRIDRELTELGRRVLGTSDRHEAVARLRDDPALHFRSRDEVRAAAEEALARAQAAIPGWFGRLPQAPCAVVPMPAHEEAFSTIAYYREPATDGSRPGQYYVNTSEPETRPRYEAQALAFHESVPGHHLQIAISQELDDLPAFRRHLGPTAFFEGWGLYTERLADEMGLYTGDLDRFGILSFDAWRACRLVVDTGMHALGWTRDQAIAFMVDHTALGRNNIENEVDRYIVWPGQALAYKTGQLEISRLRAAAEARLGDTFDIRAFHDVVLGAGAVSLPTLAAAVDGWSGSKTTG
ncbi:MAG TPA: DUF885 domain-containing protein [Candidatus Limnocylindrales bacterium]|nr:DUF885 domain-containing protein [Candidatus Limnocylindrales bacterium]